MKGVGQEKVRHESFPNGLPMPVSSELMQHLGLITNILNVMQFVNFLMLVIGLSVMIWVLGLGY